MNNMYWLYLEGIYCGGFRYTMAHIWACPPSEGDDYIFHCHPQEQKIPKPKRLQEWYKKMLDKGIIERIVLDYKVSHSYVFANSRAGVNCTLESITRKWY